LDLLFSCLMRWGWYQFRKMMKALRGRLTWPSLATVIRSIVGTACSMLVMVVDVWINIYFRGGCG
jgi:hypothetical protein